MIKPAAARVDTAKHVVLCLLLAMELFPLYMMLQTSLKNNALFIQQPWLPPLPGQWHPENWRYALELIGPYLANTVFVAVLATAGSLALAILGAYFFARHKLPGAKLLWAFFIVLMLMPGVVNIVPLFTLLKKMHLLNSLWTLVLVGIAGGQVFQLYVLRGFIEDIPQALFDAAEVDGASHFQQVRNIVIPLSGPIIGTLAVLQFLGLWNDFLLPLVLLRDRELFTLGVGLIYLQSEYVREWGRIMAAYSAASVPLIVMFLFTMKLFIRGLTAGAVKG